jgi:hypothetical protein
MFRFTVALYIVSAILNTHGFGTQCLVRDCAASTPVASRLPLLSSIPRSLVNRPSA